MIEHARCRWCLLHIFLNPFVGEWQTPSHTTCREALNEWKLHEPLVIYEPDAIIAALGDLLDVVA